METLAKSRDRRANAGSKMASMLEQEEDEFYKSTYGGFFDEDDDQEYETEGSESDHVDSDFDCEENEHDEPIQAEEEEKTNKRRPATYKEKRSVEVKTKSASIQAKPRPRPPTVKPTGAVQSNAINSKRLRTSTQMKKEATEKRKKQALKNKRQHQRTEYRELSQAELLAEAKQTEQINLASLACYEKLELERARKNKSNKPKEIVGPYIRYRSLSMPLIDPNELLKNNENKESQSSTEEKAVITKNRYARTLITFSDQELFDQYFSIKKLETKKPISAICPITKLPARYFDPVTRLPYANSFAFRTLRQAYIKQLQLIEPSTRSEEICRFLNWYNSNNNRENIQSNDSISIEQETFGDKIDQSDKEQTIEIA